MSRTLRERIARLERRRNRRPFPRVIFGIYDKVPDEVIGYSGERDGTRRTILRKPSEPLEALQARAWSLVSAPSLATLYGPASLPQSDVQVPAATPEPYPVPVDPWALAGIGRRASRDELIRMGAIPVPPERLV